MALTPPSYLSILADLVEQEEQFTLNSLTRFETERATLQSDLDRSLKQRERATRRHEKYLHSLSHWSILSTAAQYLSSVALIGTGAACLGISPTTGASLIASGSSSLLQRICTDMVPHQTNGMRVVSSLFSTLSLGFGLIGGGVGLHQHAFTALSQGTGPLLGKAAHITSAAAVALSRTFHIRSGWIEKQRLELEADNAVLSDTTQNKEHSLRELPDATRTLVQKSETFLTALQLSLGTA